MGNIFIMCTKVFEILFIKVHLQGFLKLFSDLLLQLWSYRRFAVDTGQSL